MSTLFLKQKGTRQSSSIAQQSIRIFKDLGQNLSIAQKISYGYALAIGIAVCGGAVGLVVGDFYQTKAEQALELAEEQQEYLNTLENAVLQVRSHPQQLVMSLDSVIWFEYETNEFLNNMNHLRNTLNELQTFVETHPNHIAVSAEDFLALDQGYVTTIDDYEVKMQELWTKIDPLHLKPEEVPMARQFILDEIAGQKNLDLRRQFEYLSENLLRIEKAAQRQEKTAIAGQIYADRLRLGIIISSLGVAILIATVLALRTSRAIARPLETVTKVAQNVTQDSNFSLRAPITTKDEVGLLADSLNQLIEWVGEYTQKLEQSQETLEQRVEERTFELQQALQDLKQTQAQLIQTEKMSSLGQMVAGVAHEINNPVNFIHGNLIHIERYLHDIFILLDLYQQHTPQKPPPVEEWIDEIELEFVRSDLPALLKSMKIGSDRIKEIVLSLRNFSRLDEAEMKEANIHEGIDNTLILFNHRLKQGVEIVKNYGNLPTIICYPAQLNQVFMNIIANGLDAMFESQVEPKRLVITTEKVSEEQVCIKIQDNGNGIPDEIKNKLFDPFFTTKPVGKGTGLGLSICYQIIEKHQGEITVESSANTGTEFIISLPIQKSKN